MASRGGQQQDDGVRGGAMDGFDLLKRPGAEKPRAREVVGEKKASWCCGGSDDHNPDRPTPPSLPISNPYQCKLSILKAQRLTCSRIDITSRSCWKTPFAFVHLSVG
ncbi:hypothetical protein TWF718_010871 [Orbilia javanica]|uniref:Uncharacterized protein n=1 Tax=Orbilia javanica TaxID=47235 RepID=A0AAN8RK64_9PEZI